MKTTIIAEVGVNHNGSLDKALQLVDAAADSGADIVKFQTFKAESLASKEANKAEYQKKTTDASESQLSMLKKLELDYKSHFKLLDHCKKRGIQFLSTAFDIESLEFLINELDLKLLKISSGDLTNAPLILSHAISRSEIILSTGMSDLNEIEDALSVIAFGLLSDRSRVRPSLKAFREAYLSSEGRELLKNKVTLLHCTTEYPAPLSDINLIAMQTMRDRFNLDVGYSDHSEGLLVPIAAVASGASIIEKHLTLDKNDIGPDHQASIEPKELKEMVDSIRDIEVIMGQGLKVPQKSELKNIQIARKSLVAKTSIKAGENFSSFNLTTKRPATGKSPLHYWDLLDKKSNKDYEADEVIK